MTRKLEELFNKLIEMFGNNRQEKLNKLIEPETFTYKNITYELVFIPSKSEGNVLQNPQLLFRRKDQPKCFIDFELDYEPIRNEINEIIRYKYFIFI